MGLRGLVHAAEQARQQGVDVYGHLDPSDRASLLTALVYHAPFVGFNQNRPGSSDATWPCKQPLSHIKTTCGMAWQMAYRHYQHPALQGVATFCGSTIPAGYYDYFTHQ